MKTLREIFDDLPKSSDKWEPYFDIYEQYIIPSFYNMADTREDMVFVEVGVQRGGSLDMWSQYFNQENDALLRMHQNGFSKIMIYGIDIDPACRDHKYDDPNVSVVIGDQGQPAFWDNFLTQVPYIDIFVDDGGHYMDQQILTFEKVFPKIRPGGLFICEDCHTSYMQGNHGGLNRRGTFIEYAKQFIDVLHYNWKEEMTSDLELRYKIGKDVSSVHFYDSVVVFQKNEKGLMQRVFPKLFPPQ